MILLFEINKQITVPKKGKCLLLVKGATRDVVRVLLFAAGKSGDAGMYQGLLLPYG